MTIDQVRDYWDARPCNVRHSWHDIDLEPLAYSRQVTARKRHVEPHTLKFAEFYEWIGCNVLELGCGTGTDTIEFAKHGANVMAVDLSRKSLKIAYKRLGAEGLLENVELEVHNIEESMGGPHTFDNYEKYGSHVDTMAAWSRKFDLIYSFGVLHHTPRPWLALKNVYPYLKKGGTLKVMLYHRKSWKVLRILLTNLGTLLQWCDIDRVVALESEAQSGSPVTYTFTRKEGRELLEGAGFSIQKMMVEHIFPYKVSEYVKGKYVKAFPWSIMPRWFFKWLEHRIGWHLCITAVKN